MILITFFEHAITKLLIIQVLPLSYPSPHPLTPNIFLSTLLSDMPTVNMTHPGPATASKSVFTANSFSYSRNHNDTKRC
jgi:hypothetical protein